LSIVRRAVVILAIIAPATLFAQQRFQFAQYQQVAVLFNPAFAGIEDFVDLKVAYRNRWAGIEGSPTSALVMANMAFKISPNNRFKRRGIRLVDPEDYHQLETSEEFQWRKAHRQGFSLWVNQNENLNVSDLGGFLAYSYHLPISDYIVWSIGSSVGVSNSKLDATNLTVTDPTNDFTFQAFLADGGATTDVAINLGTVLYANNWYVGYAANRVVVANLSNVNNYGQEGNEMVHNFMLGGTYRAKFVYLVVPGIMVEYTQNLPISYTLSLRMRFEDAIWGGLAYRIDDAVSISVGLYATPALAINYAFEYSLSQITGLNASTHEIVLGFKLHNRNFSRAFMW